ncbi:MAG TPA: hypothetical protein PLF35_12945, partial [Prolixibacteraceae bacterium]|nr:hypothetical protein [Prolixibacteraceae bacterium]
MNKKKNILALLFLFTIVLIVVMKLILQNEADQWRQNQLEFLTQQIEAQNQIVQNSLQQQALYVFETIMNNNELSNALFSISKNDSISNNRARQIFNQNTQHLLLKKQLDLVVLRFITKNATSSPFGNSLRIAPIDEEREGSDLQNYDTIHGISITDHTLIYSFLFPVVQKNTFQGYIEIGFDLFSTKT